MEFCSDLVMGHEPEQMDANECDEASDMLAVS